MLSIITHLTVATKHSLYIPSIFTLLYRDAAAAGVSAGSNGNANVNNDGSGGGGGGGGGGSQPVVATMLLCLEHLMQRGADGGVGSGSGGGGGGVGGALPDRLWLSLCDEFTAHVGGGRCADPFRVALYYVIGCV
jgi:hypothetical protein